MNKLILVFFTLCLFTGCTQPTQNVQWISSTDQSQWDQRVITTKNGNSGGNSISIYTDKVQQQVDGFGGCFNELGWEALSVLGAEARQSVMASLFDPEQGTDFNIFRVPMGANDYAVDWYSHNEHKGDFEMKQFDIERDHQRLIPYIKEAKTYDPNIMVWASPWAPPSWMKVNDHYACRPDVVNDLKPEGEGEEMVTQFRMEEEYLDAYALYFSKFIQAYSQEGIDIYAVHVQNEPNSCQNFPSCVWRPEDLGTFIGNHLGPKLASDGLNTEIWLGTVERPHFDRVDPILKHAEASKYITGVGFQWAGKGAIPEVHKNYPNIKLMQTETECGDGSNDWKAAEHTWGLMRHYFNHGANSYLYWNMVLNETGKSQWGWKQNSMITIDSQSKQVTYNPEFYLMKHFSNYIPAGAHKVESTDENCLAFKDDKNLTVVYYNEGAATSKTFDLGKTQFEVDLEEKSLNTFVVSLD